MNVSGENCRQPRKTFLLSSLALAIGALGSGCGVGTAAIASETNDTGTGPAPTVLSSFNIESPKVSPATLRITVTGSAAVEVRFLFSVGGSASAPMTQLVGHSSEHVTLTAPVTLVQWDFAAEPLLAGEQFVGDVQLMIEFPGGGIPEGAALLSGMGNDVPVLEVLDVPADEASGIVGVCLRLSDSSSDLVTLTREWRKIDEAADVWHPATTAGLFPDELVTSPDGIDLTFFWDTDVDLLDAEAEVIMRFTLDDQTLDQSGNPVGVGLSVESDPFLVDNNSPPLLLLDSGPIVLNPDEQLGIPIPYQLVDAESDVVEPIFQWRAVTGSFPELDLGDLDAILADPELRREHQICEPYFDTQRDPVIARDAMSVVVPAWTKPGFRARHRPSVGEVIEVYRSLKAPVNNMDDAATVPLPPSIMATHALALGEGLTALIHDANGNRLVEVELASGSVVREVTTLPSAVCAMVFEPGEATVVTARDLGGSVWLDRVDLASGQVSAITNFSNMQGDFHGLASMGSSLAVVTQGDDLYSIDYRDLQNVVMRPIYHGTTRLFGVAPHPHESTRVLVIEQDPDASPFDRGRLMEVDLAQGSAQVYFPFTYVSSAGSGIYEPRNLSIVGNGDRLLVGATTGVVEFDLGRSEALGLSYGYGAGPDGASVSSGAFGLRLGLYTGGAGHRLFAWGGLVQRRTVVSRDPDSGLVEVDEPFNPAPSTASTVRLLHGPRQVARPAGQHGTFVWDIRNVPAGLVLLRGLARDDDAGLFVETGIPKQLRNPFEGQVREFPLGSRTSVADLDRDGDVDLIGPQGVWLQIGHGQFPETPAPLSVGSRGSAVADFDGDGDLDIAAMQSNPTGVALFFQTSAGVFDPVPSVTTAPALHLPYQIECGDVDGDGDADVVVRTYAGPLYLFRQTGPGRLRLLEEPIVDAPGQAGAGRAFLIADLNGDGLLDIARALDDGVGLYLQVPSGTFELAIVVETASVTPQSPMVAADFNGDGHVDLAVGGDFGPERPIRVLYQDGPGTFIPVVIALGTGVHDLAAGDLNGDDRQDILIDSHLALMQRRDGTFEETTVEMVNQPFGPTGGHLVDIDRDGILDLLNNTGVHLQLAPGAFASPPSLLLDSVSGLEISTELDIDGDGDIDLVSSSGGSPSALDRNVRVYYQTSPGAFEPEPRPIDGVNLTPAGGSLLDVRLEDVDADGDVDVLSTSLSTSHVAVFLRDENGTYDPTPIEIGSSGFGDPVRAFEVIDVDRDGHKDVVLAKWILGDELLVYFQRSPGSFDPTPLVLETPPAMSNVGFIAAADLDGDGDIDLATAGMGVSAGPAAVFYQSAPGAFDGDPLVFDVFGDISSMSTRDMDADGAIDLVITKSTVEVRVLYQEPSGSLTHVNNDFLGGIPGTDPVDLDGDGDLDLVVQDGYPQLHSVYLQSDRSFSRTGPGLATGSRPTAMDLDGDGDADLASVLDGDTVVVHYQIGNGLFDPAPRVIDLSGLAELTSLRPIVADDIDGDGDVDLLVRASQGTVIIWGGR